VLLTRLYLRNFRVFEEELDLELPPGLVGVYGANGSGKSTLLEAVLWTLWGKARTTKEQVRTAGVGGDCVTEVEFEHEGHLYVVRRTLTGINSTPRLEANCDGLLMSEGVRDAERYIESVLGLDDGAFRASVFAEQKQIAAFSNQTPAERRSLVLRLLGITPLDGARDAARRDARRTAGDHERLRGMLPDLVALEVEAADADAKAGATEATAASEAQAADAAAQREATARQAKEAADRLRERYDALVTEGKGARQELDAATRQHAQRTEELTALSGLAEQLAGLETAAANLAAHQQWLAALGPAAQAASALARIAVPPEPTPVDEAAVGAAQTAANETASAVAAATARAEGAAAALERARELARRSADLSGEADCPVCGQSLGAAFEQVQAHRASEVHEAEGAVATNTKALDAARQQAESAGQTHRLLASAAEQARAARAAWEQADRRRADATEALAAAWSAVVAVAEDQPAEAPPATALVDQVASLRQMVDAEQEAANAAQRLRGRLEARPQVEAALTADAARMAEAGRQVQALRARVRDLGFDGEALAAAVVNHQQALATSQEAGRRAQQAAVAAAAERATAAATARRLADAHEQHAKLAELESDARHLSRVADLMSEFRNTVVASVGPRLAVQAAELFAELTDREYDELQVDPETYQLQISDGGKVYGLERFSGSEVDLANLALRVAISEHIHFQSGGTVGLLVLDEVFGPLDDDRKGLMLLALQRLGGRFRQIIVVTHDDNIKEQLPNAIQVVKLPGRRATARLSL
jgi:exonuclease SbcC